MTSVHALTPPEKEICVFQFFDHPSVIRLEKIIYGRENAYTMMESGHKGFGLRNLSNGLNLESSWIAIDEKVVRSVSQYSRTRRDWVGYFSAF